MAGAVLLGLVGILATTASEATGNIANFWNRSLAGNRAANSDWYYLGGPGAAGMRVIGRRSVFPAYAPGTLALSFMAAAASLPLIAGTLMSHSSADEMSFEAVAPYALHILLAGAWFGALPAFLFILVQIKVSRAEHRIWQPPVI